MPFAVFESINSCHSHVLGGGFASRRRTERFFFREKAISALIHIGQKVEQNHQNVYIKAEIWSRLDTWKKIELSCTCQLDFVLQPGPPTKLTVDELLWARTALASGGAMTLQKLVVFELAPPEASGVRGRLWGRFGEALGRLWKLLGNIWTTFRHFVSKVAFSLETSSKFKLSNYNVSHHNATFVIKWRKVVQIFNNNQEISTTIQKSTKSNIWTTFQHFVWKVALSCGTSYFIF